MTKFIAAIAAARCIPFLTVSIAHAETYCEFGNLLIPQEVHHVGTYRDATCAVVVDLALTNSPGDCHRVVKNYVVSRGYDPYVGEDIAVHNCPS